jgi:hypothetical protein
MSKDSNRYIALSAALATIIWAVIIVGATFYPLVVNAESTIIEQEILAEWNDSAAPRDPEEEVYFTSAIVLNVDGLKDSVLLVLSDGSAGIMQLGNIEWEERLELFRVLGILESLGAVSQYDLQTPCGVAK